MPLSDFLHQCAEGKGCLAVNSLIEVAPFDSEIDRILKQFRQRLENQLVRLVEDAKQQDQIPEDINTKEAVRLISVFLHGLSANMAAGMKVKGKALLDHFD